MFSPSHPDTSVVKGCRANILLHFRFKITVFEGSSCTFIDRSWITKYSMGVLVSVDCRPTNISKTVHYNTLKTLPAYVEIYSVKMISVKFGSDLQYWSYLIDTMCGCVAVALRLLWFFYIISKMISVKFGSDLQYWSYLIDKICGCVAVALRLLWFFYII